MTTCYADNCTEAATRKALCDKHYRRLRRTGTTADPAPFVPKLCSVQDCSTVVEARGLCDKHYTRMRNHGSTELPQRFPKASDVRQRAYELIPKHLPENECWRWGGTINGQGYGVISELVEGKPRQYKAHRLAYEIMVGDIPDGLMIDHQCHVVACVNPRHLKPATAKENSENMYGGRPGAASRYRGVSYAKATRNWKAHVIHAGKYYHLGYFADEAEAGRAARELRNKLYTNNVRDR